MPIVNLTSSPLKTAKAEGRRLTKRALYLSIFWTPTAGFALILLIALPTTSVRAQQLDLQGGTWGTPPLATNVAPMLENATFTGSTTNPAAAFGAFLQQTDNSSCIQGTSDVACAGLEEQLYLNGPSVVGGRVGAQVNLIVAATTGNAKYQDYVGVGSQCNLMATDPAGASSAYASACFGNNPVAHIGAGVNASQVVGEEIDTWEERGAVITDRIGEQIVDVMGSTYGVQATRDDVSLSLTNQYNPSSTLGFKVGLEFGRYGGAFPVATDGTLIYGQGNQASGFQVANGIDWSRGTFTGNVYNDGHVVITGSGSVGIGTLNPGAPLEVIGSVSSAIIGITSNTGSFPSGAGVVGMTTGIGAGVSGVSGSSGVGVYAYNGSCVTQLAVGSYGVTSGCPPSFTSDEQLKKDITPVENGLETIMKLNPVSFLWKMDTKNHTLVTDKGGKEKAKNYGFIAQDVEKVLPELVTRIPPGVRPQMVGPNGKPLPGNEEQRNEPKDGYMMLEYTGLLSPIVKAVQELYGKWLADHNELAALKTDNDKLRSEFEAYMRTHP